jgi:hypothetical protein
VKICPKCDHPNPEDLSVCEECGANILEVSEDGIDPFIGRVLVGKFRITELIGKEIIKVVADEDEGVKLAVGDKVMIASKAFNPIIHKIG